MTQAIAKPSTATELELSVEQVLDQVRKIQGVMAKAMRKDEHYGIIPGTDKPTLLKPGAEKLCLTFRLAPRYFGEDAPKDLGRGHREYVIRCELYHAPTGIFLGAGLGSCSTMESRYRYRDAFEPTGKPVPPAYWKARNKALIGGDGFRVKKVNGEWQIVKVTERQENPDIADVFNTVLKIAKKRAHVDAVLTVTAASDIFTQDLEDFAAGRPADESAKESTPVESWSGDPLGLDEKAPQWRVDMLAACRKIASDALIVEVLGSAGFEALVQVPNRNAGMKIYKDLQRRVDGKG